MATFAAMKRTKLIGIIFCLIVCVSIGTIVCSDFNLQKYNLEQFSLSGDLTNSLSSHHELVNEDQNNQPDKYVVPAESTGCFPDSPNCTKVLSFCISIWQPPKIF
jgi:hypothetical protein